MSVLGSLAFWVFVAFPAYPLFYLGRLLTRARSRPPILAIAVTAQNVSFVALTAWFVWVARLVMHPVLYSYRVADLAPPTRALLALSYALRTPGGALLAAALALAVVRISGRCLSSRWRNPDYPAWRIDALALIAWVGMSALLAMQVLALLVPMVSALD